MYELLERFTTMDLPDAIDSILLKMDDDPGASADAFERYAARMLGEIGASRLREVAQTKHINAVRLTATDMFWLREGAHMNQEERGYLLAAESVMNRLHLIEDEIVERGQGGDMPASPRPVTEEQMYEADMRVIEGVGRSVLDVLQHPMRNPLLLLHGVLGKRGGEWDVRTRFALAIEKLKLPYRLSYHFDCDVERGIFRVKYSVPDARLLPRSHYDARQGAWVDRPDEQDAMAARYAKRLGGLVAAAAFGAGASIERVHVSAHADMLGAEETLSMCIHRSSFMSVHLPAIERDDPAWPDSLYRDFQGHDDELDQALLERHVRLSTDTRALPEELRSLLHADTACELDVLSDMPGDDFDVVRMVRDEAKESPLATVVTLEDIIAESPDTRPREDGRYPLYCSDMYARAIVGQSAVSDDVRYYRYPDSALAARSILSDLYLDSDDAESALRYAHESIELAPTSTIGYVDAAYVLAHEERFSEAVPYLSTALQLASRERELSMVLYRLAFALWQSGKPHEGLACYVLSGYHGFPQMKAVSGEMAELMVEAGIQDMPDLQEASSTVAKAGFNLRGREQGLGTVVKAIMGLCEEGILIPAGLLCVTEGLSSYRDEMMAVAMSMHAWNGAEHLKEPAGQD